MSNKLLRELVGLCGSILIHLIIILIFIIHIGHAEKKQPAKTSTGNNIEITLIPLKDSLNNVKKISNTGHYAYSADSRICKDKDKSYAGVGIVYSPLTGVVYYIPEYYPAFKSGIRIGDSVEDYSESLNEYAIFVIKRGNVRLHFRIKMEKICYQQKV